MKTIRNAGFDIHVGADVIQHGVSGSLTDCAIGLVANSPYYKEKIKQAFGLSAITSKINVCRADIKDTVAEGVGLYFDGTLPDGTSVTCNAFTDSQEALTIAACNDQEHKRSLGAKLQRNPATITFTDLQYREYRKGSPSGGRYTTSRPASRVKPENIVREAASDAGRKAPDRESAGPAGVAAALRRLTESGQPATDDLLHLASERARQARENKGSRADQPARRRFVITNKRFI